VSISSSKLGRIARNCSLALTSYCSLTGCRPRCLPPFSDAFTHPPAAVDGPTVDATPACPSFPHYYDLPPGQPPRASPGTPLTSTTPAPLSVSNTSIWLALDLGYTSDCPPGIPTSCFSLAPSPLSTSSIIPRCLSQLCRYH
jgi:hypothetical protein